MSSDYLTTYRQFEIDSKQANAEALVEARKKANEEEAEQEIYRKMGNTLADFQTRPTWTVEDAETSGIRIYNLTLNVIFKP